MDTSIVVGFFFLLIGAACGGSFGLPSKFAHKDTPWEVLWGPFFFIVTLVIPLVLGPVLVKDFYGIYRQVGLHAMLPVLAFGLLWGLGSMTLGMSFAFIGLSLAYSLNYGAQIVFGSMVPMAIHNRGVFLTAQGVVVMVGVVVCVLGVVLSGRAGMLKEKDLAAKEPARDGGGGAKVAEKTATKHPRMLIGLLIGVLSGILCACYAVAASFAGQIGAEAAARGNAPWVSAFAVMAVILWGGAVSSCLYCAYKLSANKTWGQLAGPGAGRVLVLAASMAVLHDAAILLFGLGYSRLGNLGVSVGYAAFMSFAIIVGNVHGFRAGEWKGASRKSLTWIGAGVAVLIAGVCVLGAANAMKATTPPAKASEPSARVADRLATFPLPADPA